MAHTPGTDQIRQRPSYSRESSYLPAADTDYNLELTTPENAIHIFHGIIDIFHEIEASTSSKSLMRGMTESALFGNILKTPKNTDKIDLGKNEKSFAYFLLSISTEEFQKIINQFSQDFITGKDSTMTESDFKRLLAFFCQRENIGKSKLEKLFKKLVPSTFETCERLDRTLGGGENNELGVYLTGELFKLLKTQDLKIREEDIIDPIKLLPLLVGLYSKLLAVRISKKMKKLEMIMGIDSKGKRFGSSGASLYERFEKIGKIIDKKNPVSLCYNDIVSALESFQDSSPSNLGHKQRDLVLQDVQIKYKYSKKNGQLKKPPLYNAKFLAYIAFRICVRNMKVSDQLTMLQELVEWNIVHHSEKLDSDKLGKQFLKFAKKRTDVDKAIPLKSLDGLFSKFAIKVIPTIHKKMLDNALAGYLEGLSDKQELNILDFAERVNELLFQQAELKLQTYINFKYDSAGEYISQTPRNSNFLKQPVSRGSTNTTPKSKFEPRMSSIAKEKSHSNSFSFSQETDASNSKESPTFKILVHKSSNNTPINFSQTVSSNDEADNQTNTPAYKKPLTITTETPQNSDRTTRKQTASGSEITNSAQTPDYNSLTPLRPFAGLSNIEELREEAKTTEEKPRQDYLNSCFVKEVLFGSYGSERRSSPIGKKSKRATAPKKVRDAKYLETSEASDLSPWGGGQWETSTSIKTDGNCTPLDDSKVEGTKSTVPDFKDFMLEFKKKKGEDSISKSRKQVKILEENPICPTDEKADKDRVYCAQCTCSLM